MIKKGDIFLLIEGAESNVSVLAICRAKHNIDIEVAKEMYLSCHGEQREEYHFEAREFAEWLLETNMTEKIKCKEWFLGAWGTADFRLLEPI